MIQFIGGEPTLHPALPELMDHALDSGLEVEVFTNLVRVTPRMWETFSRPRVRLATSFYADGVDQHEVITGRQGSYARTKANIAETVGQQWGGMAVRIRPVDAHGVIRISRCDPSKSHCNPHCPPGYHSEPRKCWPYYYDHRK